MSEENPNPPEAFDVTKANITEVKKAIDEGTITAEDALRAEEGRGDDARPTLLEWLEGKTQPVNQPPAPSTSASATTSHPEVTEENSNPNEYETARVKTSKEVQANTAGKGTFFDPEQKKNVGSEPVTVLVTPFIDGLLRSKEIVRA